MESGSLEVFLVEGYWLCGSERRGRLPRGDIADEPWPMQRAVWDVEICDMARILDVELLGEPERLLFARRLDVRAWLPVRC